MFSRPEMNLLCNITEYFEQNHIDYHAEILFRDVRVSEVHREKMDYHFIC